MSNIDMLNSNQRTPCVLVLDCSGSMSGDRINNLNAGLKSFVSELKNDDTAYSRVQIAIITVGEVGNSARLHTDWCDAVNFTPPILPANGLTPLGEGVLLGLQNIENQKALLKSNGITYTRPWMFVISDGEPTDDTNVWQSATLAAKQAMANKKCEIFPISVDVNIGQLSELSTLPVVNVSSAKFNEFFVWLSGSLSSASRSKPGENIQLPSTDPWRNVSL